MNKKTKKVSIEIANGGWIVRVQGDAEPKVFFRWESLLTFLRDNLTDYLDNLPYKNY